VADERIDFHDDETDSAAFMVVRRLERGISIGFGVERNGDLDLAVSLGDGQRIADALSAQLGRQAELDRDLFEVPLTDEERDVT
jgi:hypothetical protein